MRFHQLEIGAQFEYQGERYTKTNSLIAVKQDGSQKFMQRSALVTPAVAQVANTAKAGPAGTLDDDSVLQAHERFYQTCMASIKNASLSKSELTAITNAFKEAHEQFLSELNKTS